MGADFWCLHRLELSIVMRIVDADCGQTAALHNGPEGRAEFTVQFILDQPQVAYGS